MIELALNLLSCTWYHYLEILIMMTWVQKFISKVGWWRIEKRAIETGFSYLGERVSK